MAKPIDNDELRERFLKWRARWVGIVNDAKKKNLDVAAEKKDRLARITNEVERLEIPGAVKGFKDAMTALDHFDKAVGKRGDVVDSENSEALLAFDRFMVIDETGLPLFDEATRREMEANAQRRPEAEEGGGEVHAMEAAE